MPRDRVRLTACVHRAPVRWLINYIMIHTGQLFTLDPDVNGVVDMCFKDVKPEAALDNLLAARRKVGHPLRYRIEDGVYIFEPDSRRRAPPSSRTN